MSNSTILWLLTGLLCATFAIISMSVKRRADTDFKSYAIGNGDFPFILIFFTYFATIMGAGNFFGHAGSAYEIGVPWLAYILGEQGAKILFALIFAGMAGAFTYKTLPEMIDDIVVKDRFSRGIAALMIVILLVAMTGGQSKALGQIFAQFTGLPPEPIMLIFSAVFIIFTCFGGIYSVIWNDLVQGVLCCIFAIIFYLFAFSKVDFSLATLARNLESVGKAQMLTISSNDIGITLDRFFTGLIGILVSQVIWQRCFSSKGRKQSRNSLLLSGTICLVFTLLTGCVGLIIMTLNQGLDANTAMSWFMAEAMPKWLAFTLFMLVFCAGMSTADSALNSCAVVIVNDIVHPAFPSLSDKKLVLCAKITTVFVGIASCVAGIYSESIYSLISSSNLLAASSLAPLICVGLAWKRRRVRHQMGSRNSFVSPWGARVSMIVAFLSAAFPAFKSIGALWAVFLGSITLVVVSLVENKIRSQAK